MKKEHVIARLEAQGHRFEILVDPELAFKLKSGEIICPIHGRVHIVSSEQEISLVRASTIVRGLIEHAAMKIESLIGEDGGPAEIDAWLSILEKAVRVEKALKEKREASLDSSVSSRGSAQRTSQG